MSAVLSRLLVTLRTRAQKLQQLRQAEGQHPSLAVHDFNTSASTHNPSQDDIEVELGPGPRSFDSVDRQKSSINDLTYGVEGGYLYSELGESRNNLDSESTSMYPAFDSNGKDHTDILELQSLPSARQCQ